jgi:nitrogen fixation protein FixH
MTSLPDDIRHTDRFIPWLVVLFFMVFIGVDAVMATLAVRTQTGIVTEQAYEKGLAYDRTLKDAAAQDSWHWWDSITLAPDGGLTFALHGRDGAAVACAPVRASFLRPVSAGHDFEIALSPRGDGAYTAMPRFPLRGEWHIRIWAQCTDRLYQANKTVLVR